MVLGSNTAIYKNAIAELAGSLSPSDNFFLIGGAQNPVLLTENTDELNEQLKNYSEPAISAESNFDISLRFALDSMARMRTKKIILFVSGNAEQIAAQKYNISAMKRYLNLQNSSVYGLLSQNNELMSYLANNTGGRIYTNTDRPFFASFAQDIQRHKTKPSNRYTLNYTSKAYTNLAKRYIPIEISVRYVGRSGKDEMGFFAPLSLVNANR